MSTEDRNKIGREIFLRSFFFDRPPQRLAQALVGVMQDHDYEAGDVIFEIGSSPTTVHFVSEGAVELAAPDQGSWRFEEGGVIGIIDAVLSRPRARRAVAVMPTHVLSVRYDDYLEILEDNFDFAKGALENACRTIHRNSRQLAPDGVFKPPETTPAIGVDALNERATNLIERLLVLYNAPFFRNAPVQPLVSLAAQTEEERWPVGSVLFDQGEPSTILRFVVTGRIRADLDDPKIVGWFGPGDLVGAHAAIGYALTQYRMTAEEDSIVLKVQKEDLYDLMEDHVRLTRIGFAFVAHENERARSTPRDNSVEAEPAEQAEVAEQTEVAEPAEAALGRA